MAKTLSKSRSVRDPLYSPRRIRVRILALLVDWMSWGYIAYAVMYLLNNYWYHRYVNYYGTLTLPDTWGWLVVIIATLELAAQSGRLTIPLPDFRIDCALKIKPAG